MLSDLARHGRAWIFNTIYLERGDNVLTIDITKAKHILLDRTGRTSTRLLSELSGVSIPALDKYQAGGKFQSGNADKIAAALGVSVFDILSEVEVKE